jgi:hypothetical protein
MKIMHREVGSGGELRGSKEGIADDGRRKRK